MKKKKYSSTYILSYTHCTLMSKRVKNTDFLKMYFIAQQDFRFEELESQRDVKINAKNAYKMAQKYTHK